MWALWETAFCAVFQRSCGRVLGVHRAGSVHARIFGRRADSLIRQPVDPGELLVNALSEHKGIEAIAQLQQRPDHLPVGVGTRLELSATPVAIVGGRRFTSVAGGQQHVCGLTAEGAAYCWGSGRYGQLGMGEMLP